VSVTNKATKPYYTVAEVLSMLTTLRLGCSIRRQARAMQMEPATLSRVYRGLEYPTPKILTYLGLKKAQLEPVYLPVTTPKSAPTSRR
jgi:hypothetical protein